MEEYFGKNFYLKRRLPFFCQIIHFQLKIFPLFSNFQKGFLIFDKEAFQENQIKSFQ